MVRTNLYAKPSAAPLMSTDVHENRSLFLCHQLRENAELLTAVALARAEDVPCHTLGVNTDSNIFRAFEARAMPFMFPRRGHAAMATFHEAHDFAIVSVVPFEDEEIRGLQAGRGLIEVDPNRKRRRGHWEGKLVIGLNRL